MRRNRRAALRRLWNERPYLCGDAWPELAEAVRYRTRRPGGEGAVREVCDLIDDVMGGEIRDR